MGSGRLEVTLVKCIVQLLTVEPLNFGILSGEMILSVRT